MRHIQTSIIAIITLAAFAANVMISYAQSTAFGLRLTPSHVPGAAVDNPSPANIYGPQGLNINGGIYVLKYFKSGRVGIKAGMEQGGIRFMVGVDAPRNAFGTGNGGERQINIAYGTNPFIYRALTIVPTYKLPIKDNFVEITAGPSVRHYGWGEDGFNEIILAFNRATPYNPDDPLAGPPDVRARVKDLDLFYLSFPVSIDYVVRSGKRSQVKFGVIHNISKPMHGELDVQMYGNMHTGSFRPRTGFWGVNVQYERLSKRSTVSYKKREPLPDRTSRFRKAIFVETYKKRGFLTVNYDMRLQKDRYDGFGFTIGAGLGNMYLTDVPTNNTSPNRRRLALPIGVNYIMGRKQHGVELGAGVNPQVPLSNIRDGFEYNGTVLNMRLGYRFQPRREGFTGRVAWIPTAEKFAYATNHELNLRNVGLSVGYSFK